MKVCSELEWNRYASSRLLIHGILPLTLIDCARPATTGYVCERSVKAEGNTQLPPIAFFHGTNLQATPYTACPSGHVTHSFLSCDFQSACWARLVLGVVVCGTSLLPPPPMFECSNQVERVPYPLVCDHRPDCGDFSDETFCTFPSCPGASFQCGAKQVHCTCSLYSCENMSLSTGSQMYVPSAAQNVDS